MNPTSRPTLRRWLVAGLIGAGLLLCLAALTIYFGATFSTVALVVGILAALIPVGIVVPSFLWLDRYEAEPAGTSPSPSSPAPWSRPRWRW